MNEPLISVITPTWQRPDLLLDRCVPSVQMQTYPNVEHVIVHDGPEITEDEIRARTALYLTEGRLTHAMRFERREDHLGRCATRQRALELAQGDFIAYLDDDDAYRPRHLELLYNFLMQRPEAGFVYSQMASMGPGAARIIGSDPPAFGQIGTPMILHRREILAVSTWGPDAADEDWSLVERWLAGGVRCAHLTEVTVDVWPSAYRTGG